MEKNQSAVGPPVAVKGAKPKVFMFVTATVMIGGFTDIAIARSVEDKQQKSGKGPNVHFVNQASKIEKNKLDWKMAPPAALAQRTILHTTYDWVVDILNQTRLHEKMREQVVEQPGRDYWLQLASLQEGQYAKPGITPTFETLGKESMTTLSERISQKNDAVRRLTEGLQFELNLASLWTSKSSATNRDNVRYGLVLEEIAVEKQNDQVASDNLGSDEVVGYWQAKPHWTIAPIVEKKEPSYAVELNQKKDDSFAMPSPKFKGKLIPQSTVMGQGAGKLPGMNLHLRQEQGYYEINIPVSPEVESQLTEHKLTVPLRGGCSLSRRFDADFEAVESTLNRVLTYHGAPHVNLAYHHVENRYATEWWYHGQGYGLTVKGTVPSTWAANDPANGLYAEMAYEVNL